MSEQLLKDASKAYYEGNPVMSNEEYDALSESIGQEDGVGAAGGDVYHAARMWSLPKVREDTDDKYPEWFDDIELETVGTCKLDGCAIALVYRRGLLVSATTRGDGFVGKDITANITQSGLVPTELPNTTLVQITGELVAHKDADNARNVASGIANTKEYVKFKEKADAVDLKFIAYSVTYIEVSRPSQESSYYADMLDLGIVGFNTVIDHDWSQDRPTDGMVFRLNSNTAYEEQGYTAKHPKGAFALKPQEEVFTTKLLDVIWNTGRGGKVSPVAILEEVVIDEAKITRCTLNNQAYIKALDLEIGCTVMVVRAGGVIPKIVGRV